MANVARPVNNLAQTQWPVFHMQPQVLPKKSQWSSSYGSPLLEMEMLLLHCPVVWLPKQISSPGAFHMQVWGKPAAMPEAGPSVAASSDPIGPKPLNTYKPKSPERPKHSKAQ